MTQNQTQDQNIQLGEHLPKNLNLSPLPTNRDDFMFHEILSKGESPRKVYLAVFHYKDVVVRTFDGNSWKSYPHLTDFMRENEEFFMNLS